MEHHYEKAIKRSNMENSGVSSEEKSKGSDKENYKAQTFDAIFKQNENRMHYHMQKLGMHVHDNERKLYMKGRYAMQLAYKHYDPDRGVLATYFNYVIRKQLME